MKNKEKNKNIKYIRDGMLFIFLVLLTFYILLKDQDMSELFKILQTAKLQFVFLGILCMFIYFLSESINLRRTLNELGENVTIFNTLKYSLIGFFFSSITPAATGGQPMQVYAMHKDGIKVSKSSLGLVMNLFTFQVVTLSAAMISLVFFHSYMEIGLILFFILGVTINSVGLVLLTIGIFSKKLSTWLVKNAIKIMGKFKVKNIEDKEKALNDILDSYNGSAEYIRNNKKILIKQFTTTIIQEIAYYSVPFCVFKAFGLEGHSYIKIICLQAIVYATVSGIPSPGSVGVSEGAFVSIFKTVFGEKLIKSAMLLNRGINFYLFVLVCGIIVVINTFTLNKSENIFIDWRKKCQKN